MGHTLWIHFPTQPKVPSLAGTLTKTIEIADNHGLCLTLDDLQVGVCLFDPAMKSTRFEFRDTTDWPDIVKAFFVSDDHGMQAMERSYHVNGRRASELHLRIRNRSPVPLIISATHSYGSFAERKRFNPGTFHHEDSDASNHVHLGVKWKPMALPEDIMLAFCFLEAFVSLLPESEDMKLYSEVHGPLRDNLQLRSVLSIGERWKWSWKHANHLAVIQQLSHSAQLSSFAVMSFIPPDRMLTNLTIYSPEDIVRRFGILIDVDKITEFENDDDDMTSDNYKQHRLGPLLLDEIVEKLFGAASVKKRHKCLQKVRFKAFFRVCNGCGAPENPNAKKFMVCSRCKQAVYCSRECQTSDWKEHKKSCSTSEASETVYFELTGGYSNETQSPRFSPAMKTERPLREMVMFIAQMSAQIYHRTLRDTAADQLSGPVVIPILSFYSASRRGRYVDACAPWVIPEELIVGNAIESLEAFLQECSKDNKMVPKERVELASCYWHAGRYLYQQVYRCRDQCNVVIRCRIQKQNGRLSTTWTTTNVAPLVDVRRALRLFQD